jgi:mannose-6-phosphate isomerase-like protein (cupin superfamily)
MIKDKDNSEHYIWGSNCEGWRLVDESNLSVIEEAMPPITAEKLHYHTHSMQLFYIKEGEATFSVDDQKYVVQANQSLLIKPGQIHQIINNTNQKLIFLVISQPTTKGDRFEM